MRSSGRRRCTVAIIVGGLMAGISTANGQVCFLDSFSYPDGNLDGNTTDGRTWTGAPGTVFMENQEVKIEFGDAPTATGFPGVDSVVALDCGPCEDGTITVITKVKARAGGTGGFAWSLWYRDAAGNPFGRWYGFPTTAVPRSANRTGAAVTLSTATYDELKVVIDVVHDTIAYYANDVHQITLSTGRDNPGQPQVGDTLGQVAINDWDRVDDPPFTGALFFDDLQVIGCTGDCVGRVTPARPELTYTPLPFAPDGGAVVEPLSSDFVFSNTGSVAISSYTAQEVDSSGAPIDYSWLSLSEGGGGPIPVSSSDDPITATFNSTGLEPGAHIGFVKFADSCDPARTYTRSIKLNVGDCLTETFDDYANGDLRDASGWQPAPSPVGGDTGWGIATPVQVENGVIKITGATPASPGGVTRYAVEHRRIDNCGSCEADGLWGVRFKVRGHDGGSRFWELRVTAEGGEDLAAWRGMSSAIEPISGAFIGFAAPLTGGGVFDVIEARINVHDFTLGGIPPHSTRFFINGAIQDTIDFDVALVDARVSRVMVVRFNNDVSGDLDPVVEIDDLVLTPCAPVCGAPVFDSNGDGEVDSGDLQTFEDDGFVDCSTGPAPAAAVFDALSFQCKCLDVNNDLAIDQYDFAVFQRCISSGTAELDADPFCDD